MTALPATLNIGYSTRTKATVTGIAALGWILLLTLSGNDLASVSLAPYLVAIVASLVVLTTVRNGFVIDSGALHHTTWRGTKSYAANDFQSANAVQDKNGKPGIVVRFRTGIVMLSASRGCSDPDAIVRYIRREWTQEEPAYAQPLGPVDEDLVLQYETIHIALLTAATVALAGLAAVGSMFWVAAIGAVVAGHALYRITTQSRVEATQEGVTVHRAFQAPLTIRWEAVQSIRFWYSLAHGGMKISDGTNTIRVYRWIQDYPRLNRMAQDLAPAAAFSTELTLPCSIDLNQRRYASWVTLAIAAGVSAWMAAEDGLVLAVILTGVPLAAHLYNRAANSCRLEIGRDTLRVIERRSFADSTRTYRREDLIDARLGRQLSVGGLWLRFGKERLEIANLDSSRAPEEILRVLGQEWNSEATPDTVNTDEVRTSVLTSAA